MEKTESKGLICNFCGKSDKQVKYIIAGPAVYICNECVILCVSVLFDRLYEEIEILKDAVQVDREIIFNEFWG